MNLQTRQRWKRVKDIIQRSSIEEYAIKGKQRKAGSRSKDAVVPMFLMVNALDFRFRGPGFNPWPEALRCVLGQDISLS